MQRERKETYKMRRDKVDFSKQMDKMIEYEKLMRVIKTVNCNPKLVAKNKF